jgi:DNA-binding transcriptional LysR family regulator
MNHPSTITPWPPPIDLYGLGLLRLVARHGSITRAAAEAGLTQSALTRQVQGMESRLGVDLFERTTRKLNLTTAGASLLHDTATIPSLLQAALGKIGQVTSPIPKEVRIGVSRSIAFGHLPGLLHAHVRRAPDVRTSVEYSTQGEIIARMEAGELDVGVICPPARLPSSVMVSHRMADGFHLIAPKDHPLPKLNFKSKTWTLRLRQWLEAQTWLLLSGKTSTGVRLRKWLRSQELQITPSMEPDNFDLIVHLVALGLGVSVVPRRAIAAFPRRQLLQRVPLPTEFTRELVVIVPRGGKTPTHVSEFVNNILFS